MQAMTLESTIEAVMLLSPEQQEILFDTVREKQIEARRQEWFTAAEETLVAYRRGEVKALTAEETIAELRRETDDQPLHASNS